MVEAFAKFHGETRRWMLGRCRVGIRGLMIWVAIVGTGVGWIGHRARMRQHVVHAIVRSGGQVSYTERDWATEFGWTRRTILGSSFWRLYDDCFRDVVGLWLRGTPGRNAAPRSPHDVDSHQPSGCTRLRIHGRRAESRLRPPRPARPRHSSDVERWLEIHSESVGDDEIVELRRAFPSLQVNSTPLWSLHGC